MTALALLAPLTSLARPGARESNHPGVTASGHAVERSET